MITLNNKFEVGQEVYMIRKTREKIECPACDGIGHKMIDGHKFSCTECYGTGILHTKNKIYRVDKKDKIDKIVVHICLENGELKTVIKYKFKNKKEFLERSLFATREEAEARCKELNEQTEG